MSLLLHCPCPLRQITEHAHRTTSQFLYNTLHRSSFSVLLLYQLASGPKLILQLFFDPAPLLLLPEAPVPGSGSPAHFSPAHTIHSFEESSSWLQHCAQLLCWLLIFQAPCIGGAFQIWPPAMLPGPPHLAPRCKTLHLAALEESVFWVVQLCSCN